MIAAPPPSRYPILGPIIKESFAPRSTIPVPIWGKTNVFLTRKMTTKPGFYDYEEFPWNYEFQEFFRTRTAYEKELPDGSIVLVDGPGDSVTAEPVTQCTWKKSSVAGVTEASLNGIRWMAKNDPQNVIFSIDSRTQAGEVNDIRLKPTLRRLGEKIFSGREKDEGKFLLKLRRMLIYFLGSYSSAAFAQKMAEVCLGDEIEEHGKATNVDDLRSRLKSALRPLLVLMCKPKLSDGPITTEHADGSQHVYEIPCIHCTAANGGIPTGYQQLLRDKLKFDHCKDELGQWDKRRVLNEAYFECIHNKDHKITEDSKRWFNARHRRRWRRTNFNATPGHISFHISDYYGYHPDASWGRIALKIIKAKGNPIAMQGIRNHHDGLEWELRATKTTIDDIMKCKGEYARRILPKKPYYLLLTADVGLLYIKWSVTAFQRNGEAHVIDWGEDTHPRALLEILKRKYKCAEDGIEYACTSGFIDAKYRKREVHAVCLQSRRKLWPIAGISAELTVRSISFNHIPGLPEWYGVFVFVDRDAKHELYTERIRGWVDHRAKKTDTEPHALPLWFPFDLDKDSAFALELCNEHLVQRSGDANEYLPETAREFVWKRKGPNHWGDTIKIAIVAFRYMTRKDDPDSLDRKPTAEEKRELQELAAKIALEEESPSG